MDRLSSLTFAPLFSEQYSQLTGLFLVRVLHGETGGALMVATNTSHIPENVKEYFVINKKSPTGTFIDWALFTTSDYNTLPGVNNVRYLDYTHAEIGQVQEVEQLMQKQAEAAGVTFSK